VVRRSTVRFIRTGRRGGCRDCRGTSDGFEIVSCWFGTPDSCVASEFICPSGSILFVDDGFLQTKQNSDLNVTVTTKNSLTFSIVDLMIDLSIR
jgi:hypothetical protein